MLINGLTWVYYEGTSPDKNRMEQGGPEYGQGQVKGKIVSSSTLVQIALGFFFVALGIVGIIPQAGEGIFSLSKNQTVLESYSA